MMYTNYAVHLGRCTENSWRRLVVRSINDWRVSAYALVIVSFFLIIVSSLAKGDETVGQSLDTKEIMNFSYTRAGSGPAPLSEIATGPLFLPMPVWAHGVTVSALPYQLTPMGKKPVTAKTAPAQTTATEPLAPPKETASDAPAPEIKETAPKPAPAPEAPALIAVSPFLQWIKSNPKAADEARAQANPTPAQPTGPVNNGNAVTAGPTANAPSPAPYWLPPLIDSGDFSTGPVGGSAAIYSTPQR